MSLLRKKNHLYILLLAASLAIFSACGASNLSWSDLEFAQSQLEKYDSLEDIKDYAAKNQKMNYVLAYKAGLEHKSKSEFKSAVLMFAQAYFPDSYRASKNYYPAAIYDYINSFGTKFKSKSPLANFVLYELAECYYNLFENKYALKFLDLLSSNNEILEENKVYLQARIYLRTDLKKAMNLLEDLIKKNPSPVYYMNLGNVLYKQKKNEEALQNLFKALEFDKNAWAYKLAASEILSILKDNPDAETRLNQRQRILLVEGYRLKEDYPSALKLLKELGNIEAGNRFHFAINAAKLYLSLKKFDQILQLKLLIENDARADEFYIEIGNKLIAQYRYYITYQLVPAYSKNREVSNVRLAALNRIALSSKRAEAAYALSKLDSNSDIAERVYFNECLTHLENNDFDDAKTCLTELESLTVNASTGGRARYYLGWLAKKQGKDALAVKYFESVYLNSPEHFFAFRALESIPAGNNDTSLPENDIASVRRWVAGNFNNKIAMAKFLEKKAANKNYAIDPFWQKWQKEFDSLNSNLTDQEMKAGLFMLMNFPNLAQKYLSNTEDKIKKYLIHQKLGLQKDNHYTQYFYMKLYMRELGHDIDIFTAPRLVLDMLYPTPYYDIVKEQAARFKVDPARIYAVMKQESMFHPRVGSSAGAQGLMQVMPATARGLNRLEQIQNLDLRNPEHSIILGTRFYSDMSRMFKGHFEKIAAAYNAGPGRLLEWQTRFAKVDDDLFWEKIPFEETYLYVQLTRRFYDRYRFLLQFVK